MNNLNFVELSTIELQVINGGDWWSDVKDWFNEVGEDFARGLHDSE